MVETSTDADADALGPLSAAEFEVAFVDQDGVAAHGPLAACWGQPLKRFRPVRSTGASRAGDPISVLPVLFPLLWRGRLLAGLTAPLGPDIEVRTADSS